MATLYEIDEAILSCIDLETGEILDAEKLSSLQMERDKKLESVALWYKNLLSDAEQYKAEKASFAEKEQAAKRKAESLKQWLDNALCGNPFKTAKVQVTYRKSKTVEVEDISKIPAEFLRYKEPEADKTKIKQAINGGTEISGCRLVENNNISIK